MSPEVNSVQLESVQLNSTRLSPAPLSSTQLNLVQLSLVLLEYVRLPRESTPWLQEASLHPHTSTRQATATEGAGEAAAAEGGEGQ